MKTWCSQSVFTKGVTPCEAQRVKDNAKSGDGSNDSKRQKFNTIEHPTHKGPAPTRNTLLTVDCPTMEHPTHLGHGHMIRHLTKFAREGD